MDADPAIDAEAIMIAEAKSHNGRFLLRHRYSRIATEEDPLWQTAKRLVEKRQARWISGNLWPGIELTGNWNER